MKSIIVALIGAGIALALTLPPNSHFEFTSANDELQIDAGSHICLIGNTLAERMQHDGWLETALHAQFPDHQLVIRNLGFSGDELDLRLRSKDFGSPDDHLTANAADVVFAFFGYNESYAGEEGIEAFAERLTNQIRHLAQQKYNGDSPPQLVFFSPIAQEPIDNGDLPPAAENNRRLALYSQVMQQVCQENDVRFVNLFDCSLELYDQHDELLTINGIHLNERGNRSIAIEIEKQLFGRSFLASNSEQLEPLRQSVLEKNFFWFQKYRTVDGYSIYGGRADLAFVNGQTNREVMQRELKILEQLAANRDAKIWATAQGRDFLVDDSNTDPFIPVITNKPGSGPDGAHLVISGAESIEKMTVAEGFQVQLFASEEDFPELINPAQMAFDTRGRLWVATWPTYPHWTPKSEMNDSLLILEDTDGDGRADRCTTFVDDLHCPTGFEFYGGGVLVATAPDLIFLKDTDGDDIADFRERVLHGLDSADTHHAANSFTFDPGGALYFQEGTFHHTQVETPHGPPVRSANAAVFRFEPRTSRFEVYVPYPFANPHGHVFDRWGQDIIHDGTSSVPYHGTLISGRLNFPDKHPGSPTVYGQRTRPCPATEIVSSRHFPGSMQGNLLVGNVIGFQGLLNYKIEDDGASFRGTEMEPMFSSTDESFRPVDFEFSPDGALYFVDWYNPVIGHMQHHLRDPSRDKKHGRVYRVTCKDRPLNDPVPIHGEPISQLLELLKHDEDRVRYRAKIELSSRSRDEVIDATRDWVASLDPSDADYQHHLLEGLWVHQWMNVVDRELLDQLLTAPDFRARAAAVRVLCAWRDRLPDALNMLRRLASDPAPRVRLEAVRTASWLDDVDAVDVALIAAYQPTDKYLDYQIQETIRGLQSLWRTAIVDGLPLELTNPDSKSRLLDRMDTADLLKMPGERAAYAELLFRTGISDVQRRRALDGLIAHGDTPATTLLLESIRAIDRDPSMADESVLFDLVRFLAEQPADELATVRSEIESLCRDAAQSIVRQVGYVALITIDNDVSPACDAAVKDSSQLIDLIRAMPLVVDPNLRAALYPHAREWLDGLPPSLAHLADEPPPTLGRYVRVELPGNRRVLTLAEVEVMSDGVNVARSGGASQKNTGHGGDASRALDGNRSGVYGDRGQTHSADPTDDPWWEVDLGREYSIESIAIYNRTEGDFAKRLDGFTLKILDGERKPIAELTNLPAPESSQEYVFEGADPGSQVRRAAMMSLTSVRGMETETFQSLSPYLSDPAERRATVTALLRVPAEYWPDDQAAPVIEQLVAFVESVPENRRSDIDVVEAIQLAEAAAARLPTEQATAVRRKLADIGVRMIRVATVPHRMIFDQDTIIVQAGATTEILFENNDLMPHNLVIVRPGSLEAIGNLAEATAADPGAAARGYVPQSNQVLVASRLLQPRQTDRIQFQAPPEPGVYPMVCTYPGHWRTMHSAVFVVDDLLDYLADPAAYLAAQPLMAKDPLLVNRRPRTEWKFDDLSPLVAEMTEGRSFDSGRRMFQVANCISCHRLDGQGVQYGADLSQLDAKYKPSDILRAIVEPSHEINEDYQTYRVVTIDGKTYTGLIVAQSPTHIEMVENPLIKTDPIRLPKEDIDDQVTSTVSIMPEGLLDRLSEHEVLDLVAFVLARGDRNHPVFRAAGHHP